MNPEEIVWELLLSRQPRQIRAAYQALDAQTQTAVLMHLRAMASEAGWHPEQVKSARAALDFIAALDSTKKKASGKEA